MTDSTKIEWADSTFNPWEGCTKVGPGCDHCYAEARNARFAGGTAANWGAGAPRRRTSEANWRVPAAWNRRWFLECAACGWRGDRPVRAGDLASCPRVSCASIDLRLTRRRVFCASLADVFDNEVDPAWREDLFALIKNTPNLDWLLLTKRIGNAASMIRAAERETDIGYAPAFAAWPWPNVWLGATVVNQAEADRDIPKLLVTPAAVRFLSIEPMLGPIDLTELQPGGMLRVWYDALRGRAAAMGGSGPAHDTPRIDWVITGGESGRDARPAHPDWFRSLRDQCASAHVPFLFKQWGEWLGAHQDGDHDHEPLELNASDEPVRVGKRAAGRRLDGVEHNGFPEVRP